MDTHKAHGKEFFNGQLWCSTFYHNKPFGKLFENVTVNEFEMSIELAMEAIRTLKQSAKTLQYKEALTSEISKQADLFAQEIVRMQEQEGKEKVNLHKEYERKLHSFDKQIQELKSQLSVSDLTIGKLREQLQSSEGMFRQSLEDILVKSSVTHEKEIERLMINHKQTVDMLERREEVLRSVFSEQEEKLRKQFERTQNSSVKGAQAEKDFDELVLQYTTWGQLENTAKMPHSCDRKGRIKSCDTLFELKNYSHEVPFAEVEKFERDMEENCNIPYGIFVSMKTGICRMKNDGFITMKWTARNQLLLFINQFASHSVEDIFRFMEMCSDIAIGVYKSARERPEDSDECLKLQNKIEQIKVIVEKEIARMSDFLREVHHDSNFLIQTINKQTASSKYQINASISALKNMLEVMLGNDSDFEKEEETVVVSVPIETSNMVENAPVTNVTVVTEESKKSSKGKKGSKK
jgi:hypothetical protein